MALAAINDGDVETLVPILASTTNLVSIAHAARVLNWSRDYIAAILAAIPAALDGTGLCLHHSKGRATITWVNSTRKPGARTIGRLQTMTRGLTLTQAHALRRITDGETIAQRNIGKEEKLTLGALTNMGCIELDEGAHYRPTADLRLALPDTQ